MNRRNFLARAGTGGVAVSSVGLASGSPGETDRGASSNNEVLTTFTARIERFELACETWTGDPLFITGGNIYVDGTWETTGEEFTLPGKSSLCQSLAAFPDGRFQIVSAIGGQFDPDESLTATFTFGGFGPGGSVTAAFTVTTGTSGDREGSFVRSETDTAEATLVKEGDEAPESLQDIPVAIDLEMTVADPSALDGVEIEPPAVVGSNSPQDLDGDGHFEDIRGDGEFDAADVQALFDNLDNPTVQTNAENYNFSGGSSDEVTIFDVQALFSKLGD